MTWFKVDDGFYDHPKTADLSDAAVALWTRAGAYACKHLTDGYIGARALRMLGDPDVASELVEADLWDEHARGYLFHDWHEYQESREAVEARREAARDRKRRGRAKQREQREQMSRRDSPVTDSVTPPTRHAPVTPDVTPLSQRSHGGPDPTRPDPAITPCSPPAIRNSPQRAGAREDPPRGPAVPIDGWKLITPVIPDDHPQATRTALALQAGQLLTAGTDADTITAALRLWLDKPKLGPSTLPSLVSEVIRTRTVPARGDLDAATAKVAGWSDLSARLAAQEAQE